MRDKGCLNVWLEESGSQFMDLDMPLTLVFIKLYDPVTASLTVRSCHLLDDLEMAGATSPACLNVWLEEPVWGIVPGVGHACHCRVCRPLPPCKWQPHCPRLPPTVFAWLLRHLLAPN